MAAPFTQEVPHISYRPAILCRHQGCEEFFITAHSVHQCAVAWTNRGPNSKWTCDPYGKVLCPEHQPNADG